MNEQPKLERKFLAIYFNMGMYNEDDNVPEHMMGYDCPFEDSPVFESPTLEGLLPDIKGVFNGEILNFDGTYPDVVCNEKGEIQVEFMRKVSKNDSFDPSTIMYSWGKESLNQLWKREKYRFVYDPQ